MEQDQPVDITFIPSEVDPTHGQADQAFDDFIRQEPDGDDNEAFYPPPEFEPECECAQAEQAAWRTPADLENFPRVAMQTRRRQRRRSRTSIRTRRAGEGRMRGSRRRSWWRR